MSALCGQVGPDAERAQRVLVLHSAAAPDPPIQASNNDSGLELVACSAGSGRGSGVDWERVCSSVSHTRQEERSVASASGNGNGTATRLGTRDQDRDP